MPPTTLVLQSARRAPRLNKSRAIRCRASSVDPAAENSCTRPTCSKSVVSGPSAAQQHVHVVSQRLRESLHQRQRQSLGAVEIRVVRHDHYRGSTDWELAKRFSRRLQVRVPMGPVGFEVRPFGPFVPRVDEDKRLVGSGTLLRMAAGVLEPLAVEGRRRTCEHGPAAWPPRLVVPHRSHAAEEEVVGRRLVVTTALDQVRVIVNRAGEISVDVGHLGSNTRRAHVVRREFHRRVETEITRVRCDRTPAPIQGRDQGGPRSGDTCAIARRYPGVWQQTGAVDDQQGTPVHADVAVVPERAFDVLMKARSSSGECCWAMSISAVQAIPAPRPVLVRPAQTEGKVEVGIGQQLIQRAPEQSLAAEPIVVITESMEPIAFASSI